jgi:hypothetical protein
MKITNEITMDNAANPASRNVCLPSCQKLLAQIEKLKDAILAEFRETLEAQEHLLRLALNEAEALAWQTDFPHLVFPTLAIEKVHAVSAWDKRQRALRSPESPQALGA